MEDETFSFEDLNDFDLDDFFGVPDCPLGTPSGVFDPPLDIESGFARTPSIVIGDTQLASEVVSDSKIIISDAGRAGASATSLPARPSPPEIVAIPPSNDRFTDSPSSAQSFVILTPSTSNSANSGSSHNPSPGAKISASPEQVAFQAKSAVRGPSKVWVVPKVHSPHYQSTLIIL